MSLNEELHAELKDNHKLDDATLTQIYDLFEMHQDKKEAVKRLFTLAFNRGYGANDTARCIFHKYESLQFDIEEVTEVLYLVHDWLNCCPLTSEEARISLTHEHGKHFAVLNLIMDKLHNLIDEHKKELTA